MRLEWDFSELYKFADNLKESYNRETMLMTATQNVARLLHKNLLNLTPVDTGNLRKMWSAGDNLNFTVEKVGEGYEVTFINTAQRDTGFMYGVVVNDGHKSPSGSWVMGKFFIEKSIIQLSESKQLENIIYKELEKWWDGV